VVDYGLFAQEPRCTCTARVFLHLDSTLQQLRYSVSREPSEVCVLTRSTPLAIRPGQITYFRVIWCHLVDQ
jgi:hypothetical protein